MINSNLFFSAHEEVEALQNCYNKQVKNSGDLVYPVLDI